MKKRIVFREDKKEENRNGKKKIQNNLFFIERTPIFVKINKFIKNFFSYRSI